MSYLKAPNDNANFAAREEKEREYGKAYSPNFLATQQTRNWASALVTLTRISCSFYF